MNEEKEQEEEEEVNTTNTTNNTNRNVVQFREKNTLNYFGLLLKSDCTESARPGCVVCSLYACDVDTYIYIAYVRTLRASSTISG